MTEPRQNRTLCLLVAALLFAVPSPGAAQAPEDKIEGLNLEQPNLERPNLERPNLERPNLERPGRTGLPLPRFVSLRAVEVNMRTGPGVRYPIDWVYKRQDLPVEIIDEHETWRRIRDWEGTIGWVHQSMLQGERNVLVTGESRTLRKLPQKISDPVALVEPGVIGRLEVCDLGWCEVSVEGVTGWVQRHEIYGVYPREKIE